MDLILRFRYGLRFDLFHDDDDDDFMTVSEARKINFLYNRAKQGIKYEKSNRRITGITITYTVFTRVP